MEGCDEAYEEGIKGLLFCTSLSVLLSTGKQLGPDTLGFSLRTVIAFYNSGFSTLLYLAYRFKR